MKTNEIFGIKGPEKECTDQKCPFHGNINVKKKSFVGTVVQAKMHNSAVIEWTRKVPIPKYERYTKKKTRITVHNPECIHAKEGDIVKVFATRPLSKTVHHVIVENQGKEKHYEERKEALEEGRTRSERTEKKKETEEEVEETESKESESKVKEE
ncbi:30S ribosomal protein S17 [Candidatus Woesearchaeota archaeon]|jgi:small subunit ribosomal protein S17|nr:30S ribosomal protein S17 [Candidatus Woesearchaeota archaeon]MBT4368711.1 30S ribosomal protein S17 [Candidatus Woesearchaeota archaeon]MBT4712000.1 30S ribosomal protein S17 [Candidatus Woesearchaeota archaeon]MBT6638895.1 30S ribosomal protein S17 [Candidatus Woesearchaeota archaeon]MBT7134539.1 30S ribosomal protein S17 [Candidatus Woesearchaeota archaeon]